MRPDRRARARSLSIHRGTSRNHPGDARMKRAPTCSLRCRDRSPDLPCARNRSENSTSLYRSSYSLASHSHAPISLSSLQYAAHLLQPGAHLAQPGVEARFHCAHWNLQDFSDFGEGQLLIFFHDNDLPHLGGQRLQSLSHHLRALIALQSFGQILQAAVGDLEFAPVVVFLVDRLLDYRALFPQPRMAGVQSDPVEPGRELGVTAELLQVPKRRQKSLLANITRVLVASEHAQRQPVNRPLPPSHQQAKSIGLTGERPLDDLIVAEFHNLIRSAFSNSSFWWPLRRTRGCPQPSACYLWRPTHREFRY